MLLLGVTVVNVALPAIGEGLDASFAELQWVVDAHALTLAAPLLTAGAVADRRGRRAVFAAGLVAFTACSALCAALGPITGAALAIGPLVGGLLVDGLGWRWVFLVNLPIGVVLTWLTLRAVRESRDPSARGLDLLGLVTFGAACVSTPSSQSPR